MNYCGVDPGASGAIAIIGDTVETFATAGSERDVWNFLVEANERLGIEFALIEAVHSMPKQGVSSSFKFGRSYGFLRGLLIASGISFSEIAPQTWQKTMSCRTGGDKNISKARAQQLFPSARITHVVADALLIAKCAQITALQMRGEKIVLPAAIPRPPEPDFSKVSTLFDE